MNPKNYLLKDKLIDGRTPLMIAVELGLWRAVAALLSRGANAEIYDEHGNSLYHIAAKKFVIYTNFSIKREF